MPSVTERPVHFVGISGSGMSGLARLLLGWGERVTGSDLVLSTHARRLADFGAVLHEGNRPEHVPADGRAVVVTAAVGSDNPELLEARRRGIPLYKYAEMVGLVSRQKETIAVAGTHGKSTTTGLVSSILARAGLDPSFLVGGVLREFGTNAAAGKGRHFVVEACEFDRSFLNYEPAIAIVTNVEPDHLDYYRDLGEIQEAFRMFAARVRPGGRLFVHQSAADLFRGDPRIHATIETYGQGGDADWRVRGVRLEGRTSQFRLDYQGRELGPFRIEIPGLHNVTNAAAAIAACLAAGVDAEAVAREIPLFRGIHRRFHVLVENESRVVIDDYAHHPTEIRTVLEAARRAYPGRTLWAVFQPHQHSRTRHLLDEFASSFADADRAIITDIYSCRDTLEEREKVHARDLVGRILARDGRAYYVAGFDAVLDHLEKNLGDGDVVAVMGAGSIDRLARELAQTASRAPGGSA